MNTKTFIKHKLRESIINNLSINISQDDINQILKGYIECALWTEEERLSDEATYDSDEDTEDMDEIEKLINLQGKLNRKDFNAFMAEDINMDSKIDAYSDIKTFINYAGKDAIEEAINENGLFKLGMDIWFTRNGHGAGFFDHGYENEESLTNAGRKLKSKELYIGDNGQLFFA